MTDFSSSSSTATLEPPVLCPLTELRVGETATVRSVLASGTGDKDTLESRLAGMGIVPGMKIAVLRASRSGKRPTLLAVGDTRIALGREIVERINVSR